jgi:hypothetical protein
MAGRLEEARRLLAGHYERTAGIVADPAAAMGRGKPAT